VHVVMVDAGNVTPSYVYPLCRALATAGCQIELFTAPFPHDELPRIDVPVHLRFGRLGDLPLGRRSQPVRRVVRALEYPFDWATVLRHVRATCPDVVHVQWAMLPIVDTLAFRAVRRLRVRLVYTVFDIRPHYGRWRRALLSTRPLFDLADDLVVHTEANRAKLCDLTGLPSSRVSVITHGNLVDWAGPPMPRAVARSALGLPANVPIALFFGGIKPYKRLGFALRAFQMLLERLPSAWLLIAGRPDGSFAPYEAMIDGLGLRERVITRLGYVPEDQVSLYFSAADVLALPYTDADFSAVVLAAYTFGRPVLVTETGGLHQVIEDGASGLITPPDNIEAFAKGLERVMTDHDLAERMGTRARELALKKFNWSVGAAEIIQVYQRLG